MTDYKSDIEIAREAKKLTIMSLAEEKLGLESKNLEPYGHYKAKIPLEVIESLEDKKDGV